MLPYHLLWLHRQRPWHQTIITFDSRSRFDTQGGHKLIFAILAMNSPHNQTI
jgi:hypothetical protein